MIRDETFQIEPPERTSSGTRKLLLGIGIGCGVMALLCCGLFMGVGWWAVDFVRNSVSTDPADIRAQTERIATLKIPERFEPEAMLRIDPPFMDEIGSMVVFSHDAADETLVLGDYRGVEIENRPPSEVFRDADSDVSITMNGRRKRFSVEQDDRDPAFEESTRETLERDMRGGTARFEIIQGKDTKTDRERIIVYGTFPGRTGGGVFMMSVAADQTTLDEVKAVIRSLE